LVLILLISFSSYYISPNTLPPLSVLSLFVPTLIIINVIFVAYWLVQLKYYFLISTIALLVGYQYVSVLYKFKEKTVLLTNDIKIMSYNVRMFNFYKWIDDTEIEQKIVDFINTKDPDIICFQEYHEFVKHRIKYPYKFIKITSKSNHTGQAIFSKYKIINSGSLNFSNSTNNAIFIDILKDNDTVRIYNLHLESLRINPEKEELTTENSEKLKVRLETGFKIQTNQVNLILQHQNNINHRTVICGDFNNTAFSWAYKQLKEGKKDAFEEAGEGFGSTFNIKFPIRIDFILCDEAMEVNNFKTYYVKYSDHYPIMARLQF
jgi:endonuclease/exonuclease/phosphatase family metal-dependent hydrolase